MPISSEPAYDPAAIAGAVLSIDLDAICANYRLLRAKLGSADCAAVVKGNAYGLGVARVAPALAAAGCEHFFVAQIEEGLALREHLPESAIYVLNGPIPGGEALFAEHDLVPVLNHLGQIKAWQAAARARNEALPAIIHLGTGMNRLGLPEDEVDRLAAEPERLDGIGLRYVISHLIAAEERDNPRNAEQRVLFDDLRGRLPPAKASFANGAGIFLGPDYHYDLVRPGAVLYGVNPEPGAPNPMAQVVRLEGRILQLRDVDSPQTVGYGATHKITEPARIATIALGYADGYPRHLSDRGRCFVDDVKVPVVGRVSMDLITLDISEVPRERVAIGDMVEVLGPRYTVDDAGTDAGTLGYEILTSLGHRYHRRYVGG